jgi:hypothetical protein
VRAISVHCVSVQSLGEERRNGLLTGDYGDRGRIESERDLFWGRRSDEGMGENVLPGVVRERSAGAMDLIHECADPREVGRGSDFVVEEGVLVRGGRTRGRRGFI